MSTDTDTRISATVNGLAASQGLSKERLAELIGMSRSTFFRHLASGGWSAVEVQQLADVLGVTVGDLYDGLGGRLGRLPRLDSNQQPSDYRSLAAA